MVPGPSAAKTITATVSSTALKLTDLGFSAADVQNADRAIISVSSGAVRVTWDLPTPNAPSTTAGLKIVTNNWPWADIVGRSRIANLEIVRDGGSDASVAITLESGL